MEVNKLFPVVPNDVLVIAHSLTYSLTNIMFAHMLTHSEYGLLSSATYRAS